jgi:hypothetical protein
LPASFEQNFIDSKRNSKNRQYDIRAVLHMSMQRRKDYIFNLKKLSFGGNSSKDVAENERANKIEDGDGDGEAANDA